MSLKYSYIVLMAMMFVGWSLVSELYYKLVTKNAVPIAAGVLGTSLILAHIMAPNSYSWKTNTISELGAQNYKYASIIRVGFITFGSIVCANTTRELIIGEKHWSQTIPLIVYGSAIALTGVFSEAPFEQGVPYSEKEARLHSLFANVAGIGLSGAIIGNLITDKDPKMRLVHIGGMGVVLLSSALFKMQPEYQGIWQRVMWTGGLTWMTLSYNF